jgi:uncharacterized SAM-binding protein YcdF (DUF218 family)
MGEPERIAAAREIFAHLAMRSEPVARCDAAIGFGHFDLRIPRRCGALYAEGLARGILFTGGIGAGTADLGQPEALAFREELRRTHPQISDDAVVVESESTNTSENIAFTARKLAAGRLDFCFGRGILSAILVASPYRQRRVWLTCVKQLPGIALFNAPPESRFEEEMRLFAAKGQDLIGLLGGEIDRIVNYGELGYIEREAIPEAILTARRALREAVGGENRP